MNEQNKNLTNEESNFQNILKNGEDETKENYLKYLYASNVASFRVRETKKKKYNSKKVSKPFWSMAEMTYQHFLTFKIYTTLKDNPTLNMLTKYKNFKDAILKNNLDIYGALYNTEDSCLII